MWWNGANPFSAFTGAATIEPMVAKRIEETVLGFDVREMWLTGYRTGRPDQFLLRTDLKDVFSADTVVWPSVFKTTATYEIGPQYPRPQWVGPNGPFWADLDELLQAI